MLKKQSYSQELIDLFKKHDENTDINWDSLHEAMVIQAGYLLAAQAVSRFLNHPGSKNGIFRHLMLQRIDMYSDCELTSNLEQLRGQNVIFSGDPGIGKTYSSIKLTKDYYCVSFIPPKFRESKEFFGGRYAQGTALTDQAPKRKIVFAEEHHCIEMFGRQIKNISAMQHSSGKIEYGCYDLEDLYHANLLVVQDLGDAKAHPQYASTMLSVLNNRMSDLSKTTIFTTNCGFEELSNIYGAMFVDRLKGNFKHVHLTGPSKRAPKNITRTEPEIEFYVPGKQTQTGMK